MIDVHPMRDGFALRLDLGDPLQRAMAAQRRYESDVTWVYPYLLRPGDRVVDGGAHIGYLTLLASRCVGPSGEVHAFEPVPRTFAALGENVRLNRATNVRTNRVALAARAGEIEEVWRSEECVQSDLRSDHGGDGLPDRDVPDGTTLPRSVAAADERLILVPVPVRDSPP